LIKKSTKNINIKPRNLKNSLPKLVLW